MGSGGGFCAKPSPGPSHIAMRCLRPTPRPGRKLRLRRRDLLLGGSLTVKVVNQAPIQLHNNFVISESIRREAPRITGFGDTDWLPVQP
jgi:hypothetical protein